MTIPTLPPSSDINTMGRLDEHLKWCRAQILASMEDPNDGAKHSLALGVAYGAIGLTWAWLCDAMGYKEAARTQLEDLPK